MRWRHLKPNQRFSPDLISETSELLSKQKKELDNHLSLNFSLDFDFSLLYNTLPCLTGVL